MKIVQQPLYKLVFNYSEIFFVISLLYGELLLRLLLSILLFANSNDEFITLRIQVFHQLRIIF